MPKINIYEKENISIGQLSATESNVLVPLFVKDDTNLQVTRYSNARAFKTAIPTNNVTLIGDGIDPSYYMICELIGKGLPVYVKPHKVTAEDGADVDSEGIGSFADEAAAETALSNLIKGGLFEEFKDKNLYNIKFITTGAHANALVVSIETSEGTTYTMGGCYDDLAAIAQNRTDALALVEFQADTDTNVNNDSNNPTNIISRAQMLSLGASHMYSAIFYPWGTYKCSYSNDIDSCNFPACFGYLSAFANSIITNDDWLAASGVSRGYVPGLSTLNYNVGDALMHILQGDETTLNGNSVSMSCYINPIMYKGSYGIRVWGNKVGYKEPGGDNTSYRTYLNVRMLICDIAKQMYASATRVTFEPNDDITWINFKGLNNTLLDRMQSGRGIDWYSWQREDTPEKAKIVATLYVKPIEAVEYFDLTVTLTDQGASVTEEI